MAWNKADLDRSYKTLSPDDKKVIDERVTKSVAQWLDSRKTFPPKAKIAAWRRDAMTVLFESQSAWRKAAEPTAPC